MKASYILLSSILFFVPFSGQSQDLAIYPLKNHGWANDGERGFIPLTDWFPVSEHPGLQVIADEHLGDLDLEMNQDHYHELKGVYRKRFLKAIQIKEQDFIFIYYYQQDTIFRFRVKDISLVAGLNIYGPDYPVTQYDYHIGFELKDPAAIGDYFYTALVSVGKKNPFTLGQLKPMLYDQIDSHEFPSRHSLLKDSLDAFFRGEWETYRFTLNGLDYFVRRQSNLVMHVLVIDTVNLNHVFETVYYDHEGGYLTPCRIRNELEDSEHDQWTGVLFKNRPPVILGFTGHSFGCESITFLDSSLTPINIRCDNRH